MQEPFLFSVLPVDSITVPLIGREFEINKIKAAIERFQNISIVGDIKIGKTSMLKTIETGIQADSRFEKVIPVFIDLDKFSYNLDIDKLLDRIIKKIFQANEELRELYINYEYDKREEFSEIIEYCNSKKLIILLLLDNFDSITVLKNLTEDFFTFLRGNAIEMGLSIITASRGKLETLCHRGQIAGSQFWNIFNPIITLSVFEDIQYAKELLSRGIHNEKNKNLIISLVGIHPCFLKVAANAIIENGLSDSDNEEAIRNIVYDKIIPYYEKSLKLLMDDENNIDNGVHYKLEYSSILNLICFSELNDEMTKKREFTNLKNLGYIKINSEGKPEFSSPLFAKYLKEQYNFNKKPEPYIGSDPYIFVSYAHTDKDIVFLTIEKLQKLGYRIWYDYGIPVSAKWKNEIEGRVEKCNKFIFFLSRNSSSSKEVNIEIQKYIEYSGRGKYNSDFVMILLDDIKLCKNENTCESVDFVISDCNGVHFSKEDDNYVIKVINKLGIECKG